MRKFGESLPPQPNDHVDALVPEAEGLLFTYGSILMVLCHNYMRGTNRRCKSDDSDRCWAAFILRLSRSHSRVRQVRVPEKQCHFRDTQI
jgi:hypothetical protein